jgi:hypothetical protein
MNELYLIKSGDNGFVEETSAVISADSGEISINDSLYVESAGNIGIGSSNPVNKLDVVGSASISNDLTVQGITFTNVGGNSPSSVNDIIKYDGNNWVVAASSTLPGGGGGSTNSDVPAGLIDTLTQGEAIHEVTFGYDSNNDRIVYDNVPKIAASLEIDGAGEIIPHTVSGVSESGYYVVFSEELPTANYRMHTVFGGTDAFWETGVANLQYSERSVEIDRSLYVGQKVGIGTTNPSDGSLHLRQTGNDAIRLERYDSGANNANIYFGHTGAGFGVSTSGKIGTTVPDLFISSAGNVGIGTTNPGSKLHVDGNIYLSEASNLLFLSQTGFSPKINNSTNDQELSILTDNQVRVHVDTDGNVGIGTTSPNALLDVTGSLDLLNSAILQNTSSTGYGLITKGGGNGKSRYIADFRDKDNSSALKIDGDGNVGIGTTNPSGKLEVLQSSATNTLTEVASFLGGNYNSVSNAESFKFFHQTTSLNTNRGVAFKSINGSLQIQTIVSSSNASASNNISLQPDGGNVGIGTTSPVYGLDVVNTETMVLGGSDDGLGRTNNVNKSSRIGGMSYTNSDRPTHMMMHTSNSSASELFIGWGTGSMDCPTRITFGTAASKNTISNNASNIRMVIDSNGRVGIGTTNPGTYKLHVNGTLKIYGTSFVDSNQITSDDRVKHNEQSIVGAIETLGKITPKKYIKTKEMYGVDHNFKLDADGNPVDENGESVEHCIEAGVIAQQVLTVDELAFAVNPEDVDEDGNVTSPYSLDYNSLFTYAIAAIQEQQTMIEDLKKEIEQLKS